MGSADGVQTALTISYPVTVQRAGRVRTATPVSQVDVVMTYKCFTHQDSLCQVRK